MASKNTNLRTMTPSWDLFKPNLDLLREHYVSVIYLFLLPSLVAALGNLMIGALKADSNSLNLTSSQVIGACLLLISLVWQAVNIGPLTYFQLRVADGKTDTLSDYYRKGLKYDIRLILYYLAFTVMAIVGFILFVIPGLYVIRRYFLGSYYLVENDMRTSEALKQSAERSKSYSGAIWGIIGVQVSLIFLSIFVQSLFSYVGIILGELIACSYVFLAVLRYREIEPRSTTKKA
jgi:hypothetical protein